MEKYLIWWHGSQTPTATVDVDKVLHEKFSFAIAHITIEYYYNNTYIGEQDVSYKEFCELYS